MTKAFLPPGLMGVLERVERQDQGRLSADCPVRLWRSGQPAELIDWQTWLQRIQDLPAAARASAVLYVAAGNAAEGELRLPPDLLEAIAQDQPEGQPGPSVLPLGAALAKTKPGECRAYIGSGILTLSHSPGQSFSLPAPSDAAAAVIQLAQQEVSIQRGLLVYADTISTQDWLVSALGLEQCKPLPYGFLQRPVSGLSGLGMTMAGRLRQAMPGQAAAADAWAWIPPELRQALAWAVLAGLVGLGLSWAQDHGRSAASLASQTPSLSPLEQSVQLSPVAQVLNQLAEASLARGIERWSELSLEPESAELMRLVIRPAQPKGPPRLGDKAAVQQQRQQEQALAAVLAGMPGIMGQPEALADGGHLALLRPIPRPVSSRSIPIAQSASSTSADPADRLMAELADQARAQGLALELSVVRPRQGSPHIQVLGSLVPVAQLLMWVSEADHQPGTNGWKALTMTRVTEHQGRPLPEGLVTFQGQFRLDGPSGASR